MEQAENMVTVVQVKDFFGYSDLAQFRVEWLAMPEKDQEEVKMLVAKALTEAKK